jgi:hypothetical protein
MSKTRIIGICVTVAVAVVYFYFNPLAPRIYESTERVKAKQEAQNQKAQENNSLTDADKTVYSETNSPEAVLTESLVKSFAANYEQIRAALENFKLGETKDPEYAEVKKYCIENKSFDAINEALKNYGIESREPLAVYFAISNAYGIVSYDRTLLKNPKQQRIIERMAGETIEKLRTVTHPDDIAIVADNFETLDEVFRKYAAAKKKK